MSDPNPYPRLHPPHHPSQGVSRPPLARSIHGSGLFYATFQPILGTQKCFPRDFRDQFSVFPKIFWIRELFFEIVSRILGGAKGRFCPVAGGGVVALCLPSCGRSRCGPVPGVLSAVGGLDRPGLQADGMKTGGRCRSLRPGPVSISTGSARGFLALSRYCYAGFLARLDL